MIEAMNPEQRPVRVALYSDQPVLAVGLEFVLTHAGGFEFAGSCFGVQESAARAASECPDILVLDVTSEITLNLLADLRNALPDSKLVLWTSEISTELAFQALGLGVRGILPKTARPESLVECLCKVQNGELWYDKELADNFFAARRVVLTPRESQLVNLISSGLKNKEIASALSISEGTVKVYLARLFHKVGVKDRFELALFGLKNLTSGHGRAVGYHSTAEPASGGLRSLVLGKASPAQETKSHRPPTRMLGPY